MTTQGKEGKEEENEDEEEWNKKQTNEQTKGKVNIEVTQQYTFTSMGIDIEIIPINMLVFIDLSNANLFSNGLYCMTVPMHKHIGIEY